MMSKRPKGKTDSICRVVCQGLLSSLLICLAGAVTGTFLLSNEIISENTMFVASVIIWGCAAFAGPVYILNKTHSKYLLSVALSNTCLFAVLAGNGILFFDSNFKYILAAFLTIIAGSVASALLFMNRSPKKNRKFRYKK